METVTVEGKVYQIGGIYKYDGAEYCFLKAVKSGVFIVLRFGVHEVSYPAGLTATPLGTITDAPLELEDSEWYLCKFKGDETVVFWTGESWCDGFGDQIRSDWQGDIIPIHKMVKG